MNKYIVTFSTQVDLCCCSGTTDFRLNSIKCYGAGGWVTVVMEIIIRPVIIVRILTELRGDFQAVAESFRWRRSFV